MVENPKGPYQNHQNDGDEQDVEEIEDEEMEGGNEEENFPESEGTCLNHSTVATQPLLKSNAYTIIFFTEFEEIDSQLDMLNSVLDTLEHKNEVILAQLTSLLKENREIRMQLQQCPGLQALGQFAPEKN